RPVKLIAVLDNVESVGQNPEYDSNSANNEMIVSGGISNDKSPTLIGTGEFGTKITVVIQNASGVLHSIEVPVNADGTWVLDLAKAP
ncbi:hypothetical protein NL318_28080, partial [Klebsiella pneumoniae]|nr:hypothetical protein [Klebsiella pneumoniae]